jgi:hypothetical protein
MWSRQFFIVWFFALMILATQSHVIHVIKYSFLLDSLHSINISLETWFNFKIIW